MNKKITKKSLQQDNQKSVIRHIHNGVEKERGLTKQEKTKNFLLNSTIDNKSQLEIAKKVKENFEKTLVEIVDCPNENGIYRLLKLHRLSKVVLINAILVKQKNNNINITEEMINILLKKNKKELIDEIIKE